MALLVPADRLTTDVASLSGHITCGTMLNVARERLVKAAAEYRRIEADLVTARSKLADAMYEAAQAGMPQTEIIKISGYTREHVRRIVRQVAKEREEQGSKVGAERVDTGESGSTDARS